MPRQIKFRAKRVANGEWVYGYYLVNEAIDEHKIHHCADGNVMATTIIDPTTLGQMVKYDGKEIYEGNLYKRKYPIGYSIYEVKLGEYDNEMGYEDNVSGIGFYLVEHEFNKTGKPQEYDNHRIYDIFILIGLELVGNIHDNPELIKDNDGGK